MSEPPVSVTEFARRVIRQGKSDIDPWHGKQREQDRNIHIDELREIIREGQFTGRSEPKDHWDPPNKTFTFRGKVDGKTIETAVYFIVDRTAIGLSGELDYSKVKLYFLTFYVTKKK